MYSVYTSTYSSSLRACNWISRPSQPTRASSLFCRRSHPSRPPTRQRRRVWKLDILQHSGGQRQNASQNRSSSQANLAHKLCRRIADTTTHASRPATDRPSCVLRSASPRVIGVCPTVAVCYLSAHAQCSVQTLCGESERCLIAILAEVYEHFFLCNGPTSRRVIAFSCSRAN